MKKVFAVLAIAGALVACNNNSDSTTKSDSTTVKSDSSAMSPAPTTDTANKMGTDTTHKMSDTTKMKTTTTTKTKMKADSTKK
jgi:hypothetical protein